MTLGRSQRYLLALCGTLAVLVSTGLYLIWTDDFSGYTHYEVLSVLPTATSSEIKKAYRNMALQYHPDKSTSALSSVRFQHISDAYSTLNDEVKRREYDIQLQQEKLRRQHHQGSGSRSTMTSSFNFRPKSMRLPDVTEFILVEVPRRILYLVGGNLSPEGLFKFLVVLGTACFVFDHLLSLFFTILGGVLRLFVRKRAAPNDVQQTRRHTNKALQVARERQQEQLREATAAAASRRSGARKRI